MRPVTDQPLLRAIAGLDNHAPFAIHWQPSPATTVRYWFDCWPQPWMGVTVAEELGFGLAADQARMQRLLQQWQADGVALDQPMLQLRRPEALRIMLARTELGGCDLLLMEQPDGALSDSEAASITRLIRDWLQRSGAMAILTSHRRL